MNKHLYVDSNSLLPLATILPLQISIYTLLCSEFIAQSLQQFLRSDRYVLTQLESVVSLFYITEHQPLTFDCLIVQDDSVILKAVEQLYDQGSIFPIVIIKADTHNFFEHPASVKIDFANFIQIDHAVDQAIDKFINLPIATKKESKQNILQLQQQKLAEKFPEKSCYIVGIHRRDPQYFYQQMPPEKQQILWQQMNSAYRQILLNYFGNSTILKQEIDNFINMAFCSNVPVPQVIEIHMELIDEFSKQLKLEGRSDDILLDYRLTLIDVLAHLCEVYRFSIPK